MSESGRPQPAATRPVAVEHVLARLDEATSVRHPSLVDRVRRHGVIVASIETAPHSRFSDLASPWAGANGNASSRTTQEAGNPARTRCAWIPMTAGLALGPTNRARHRPYADVFDALRRTAHPGRAAVIARHRAARSPAALIAHPSRMAKSARRQAARVVRPVERVARPQAQSFRPWECGR